MMHHLSLQIARYLLIAFLALVLGGCGAPAAEAPPALTATSQPATVTAPRSTPSPTTEDHTADLEAFVAAQLQPPLDGAYEESGWSTVGLAVRSLTPLRPDQPLWAVFSTGTADPSRVPHFVALYTREATAWRELGRLNLEQPFVVTPESLRQVQLRGQRVWLVINGNSGLVGPCCVDLLSFDGATFSSELAYTARTISAVTVEDEENEQPVLVITVQPWQGASAPPASSEQHRFVWDGSAITRLDTATP